MKHRLALVVLWIGAILAAVSRWSEVWVPRLVVIFGASVFATLSYLDAEFRWLLVSFVLGLALAVTVLLFLHGLWCDVTAWAKWTVYSNNGEVTQ